MNADWIEHRREGDRELLGWMEPRGDGFVAIDRLGREATGVVDWLDGETVLEDHGIGYMAEPFELRLERGEWLRVRLQEVSPDGIVLVKDDWGTMAVGAEHRTYRIPFPAGDRLREVG